MPQRKKILLSDPDEDFCMLLREALHEHGGFHIFRARDGEETADAIQRHKPDVLVLDHRLPHKGGFHVMEQANKGEHRPPTILMTTRPTRPVVEEAFARGARFVLPKPFTAKALVRCIHDTLHGLPPDKSGQS